MYTTKIASLSTLLGISAIALPQENRAVTKFPNIVIILMDDMGYGDIGYTGANGYRTPAINKLVSGGMFFTQYYTPQAVSSASRAGLLTGCYPNRIGITGALFPHSQVGLSEHEKTIADVLKDKGYVTAAIGKWHLGDTLPFLPLQHGFDEYLGVPYSNDMWPNNYDGTPYSRDDARSNRPPLPVLDGNKRIKEIKTMDEMSELTAMYTERAVDFIHRNAHNPFFLYLPHSMVHTPIAASDRFKGKSEQGKFGDVMMEVDWSVSEVMKALENTGIASNTLIIFTSDNGPWLNFGDCAGSSGGFREGKGTSFEGGQRVPCIMYWPGHISPGSVCNRLASAIDFLPTLADLAGAPLPENKIDGVSLKAILDGDPDANPRKSFLFYYEHNSLEAVRYGNWKLVLPHPSLTYVGYAPGNGNMPGKTGRVNVPQALYDLRRDPGEAYDVSAIYPEIVEQITRLVMVARDDLGDDLTGHAGKGRREAGQIK